jgi:hypothetical protein
MGVCCCRLPACQLVELCAEMRNQFEEGEKNLWCYIDYLWLIRLLYSSQKHIYMPPCDRARLLWQLYSDSSMFELVCEDVNKLSHIRVWTFLERGNCER